MAMDMRRVEMEDIVKEIEAMRETIKYGGHVDAYDMEKWLDLLAGQVEEADRDIGERLQDAEDEARDAMMYQETYLNALHHAERHIEWLEHEFSDEIVAVDKYERDC